MPTIVRHCPACGRRFEIRLVSKEAVGQRLEQETITRDLAGPGLSTRGRDVGPTILEESVPTTVEVTDFQYSYRCKHCGHEWAEKHTEQRQLH